MSYNYGAKNYDRVREAFGLTLKIAMTATVTATLVMHFFPHLLAQLFTPKAELIALVSAAAPIYFAGIWAFGAQVACQNTFLALGQAKVSLFFALLRKVFLLVPLAYFLPRITGDVMTIYRAEPIADIIAASCTLVTFLVLRKKLLPREE